ncbi:MAG: hypothetical protein H6737_11190 [Alphaproteobacteria bacterium]|nr:hypothetical protein [Alphaproteobacteria bacterium]
MANDRPQDWGYWLRLHGAMFPGEEWQILFDLLQSGGSPTPSVAYRIRREHPEAPWFNGSSRYTGQRWVSQHAQARTYDTPKGAAYAARQVVGEAVEVVPFCQLQAGGMQVS